MKIRYKLSSQDKTTRNGYKLPDNGFWFEAEDITSPPKPCTNTVLHHYADPHLALLFNPVHASIENPRLFEIEIDDEIDTDGLKGWCRKQRIIRELPIPEITTEQRVAFAICCAEPYGSASADWQKWATNWMSGTDRSSYAAYAAYAAANAAANATYAAYAAYAAANAAYAAYAANAAANAANAAYAAANAAYFVAKIFISIKNRVFYE